MNAPDVCVYALTATSVRYIPKLMNTHTHIHTRGGGTNSTRDPIRARVQCRALRVRAHSSALYLVRIEAYTGTRPGRLEQPVTTAHGHSAALSSVHHRLASDRTCASCPGQSQSQSQRGRDTAQRRTSPREHDWVVANALLARAPCERVPASATTNTMRVCVCARLRRRRRLSWHTTGAYPHTQTCSRSALRRAYTHKRRPRRRQRRRRCTATAADGDGKILIRWLCVRTCVCVVCSCGLGNAIYGNSGSEIRWNPGNINRKHDLSTEQIIGVNGKNR